MTTPTRAELLARLQANPRFRPAELPGAAVVIVGASHAGQGEVTLAGGAQSQPQARPAAAAAASSR